MIPEDIRFVVNGILTFLGFTGLMVILYWQIRIWPRDRQMASSLIFIFALAAVIGQLCMIYFSGLRLGDGLTFFYAILMIAIAWLAVETRKFNRRVLAHQERTKRKTPPLDEPRPL